MSSNILSYYYKLLQEYDKILNLTDKLLYALRSNQTEAFLKSLLEERSRSLQIIQKVSRSLSEFEPSHSQKSDAKMVSQLKSFHGKLEEKAGLLQKKERELHELVKDLD